MEALIRSRMEMCELSADHEGVMGTSSRTCSSHSALAPGTEIARSRSTTPGSANTSAVRGRAGSCRGFADRAAYVGSWAS